MLKPYFKRVEHLNLLVIGETEDEEEIPVLECVDKSKGSKLCELLEETRLKSKLSEAQQNQLEKLLNHYSELFSNEPGCTDLAKHDIELEEDKPIIAKPYRMSPRQTEILKAEVNKMLELNVIERGDSDFTSPLILVEVPGKDPRPCIVYRRLNKVTRTQYFPIPNIEELIEKVSSAKYISVLDLTRGYWQIPLSKQAQRYAAFVTSFGTFRPLRLPFGLKNAPYDFSRLMASLLRDCEEFAVPYLDDVAIFSNTWEDHVKHLEEIFVKMKTAKLHLKPSKCQFAREHVKYLGHIVGQGQRKPGELKIQAVKEFPRPQNKTQIRSFLGLAGYYRRYIPDFSVIAAPLTDLLKGKYVKSSVNGPLLVKTPLKN
ncbi:hypothetical protein JTE90_009221 [Oedothorax gibbosus]|uniref:RNA-directed DNA polymerase n=1 Tax=Oedothorax gibbosus TaxID=931172 RepID=A0AAV6UQ95_9ARAC|nr:hypothetical protein JTE90_009221 [Oedothorax gibbosus]